MSWTIRVAIVGGWLSLTGLSVSTTAQATFPAKGNVATAQKRVIEVGGASRDYLVQPATGAGPFPVLVLVHGMMVSAEKTWTISSLPTLAARHQFILVAPQGLENQWRDDTDVGFIRSVIRDVVRKDRGDPKSIFMLGFSMGGHMTIEVVCRGETKLRGAGTASMGITEQQSASCKRKRAPPWFEIHGDKDSVVPFNGGAFTLRPGTNLLSASDTFQYFADRAGCSRTVQTIRVPDLDKTDGSTADKIVRTGCAGHSASVFYVVHNAGHSLPGGPRRPLGPGGGDPVNEDFDTGLAYWSFMEDALKHG